MKHVNKLSVLMLAVFAFGLSGCSSSAPKMTGYLGDYRNLRQHSATSYRYTAPGNALADYDRFIIEPVVVYFHGRATMSPTPELRDLATYFRGAIIREISGSYGVVNTTGPRTARVRIALTDVQKSTWWANLHPGSKLTGAGTGQAAMEGEVLDSVTGTQIAALVESQRGNQFELDTFNAYDDAHDAIDDWAKRFKKRLDEAHGR